MERYVQISGASMRLQMDNQRMIATGLANQNTVAFKRDYATTSSIYFDVEDGTDRVFPSRRESSVDSEAGRVIPTDNPLDVAIEGVGYFTAKNAAGESVLTRRGDMRMGADRILRNSESLTMDDGGGAAITLPLFDYIEVTRDGSVIIRTPGAPTDAPMTVVARLKMVQAQPANIEKGPDGMLRIKDKTNPPADANITLSTRSLESSNVNSIDMLVDMLNASRSFEIHVKLLATAKELDDQTAKLMRSDR